MYSRGDRLDPKPRRPTAHEAHEEHQRIFVAFVLVAKRLRGFTALFLTLAGAISLVAAQGSVSLIDAVKADDLVTVRSLLARRADPNVAEADGTTALHWAVENDDDALVALLLEAGAKAQMTNRHGIAPLHRAATNGNAAIITRLIG